jgi:hypothetical protein
VDRKVVNEDDVFEQYGNLLKIAIPSGTVSQMGSNIVSRFSVTKWLVSEMRDKIRPSVTFQCHV